MTLNLFARLGLALLMALPVVAHAETDELPPLPDRNPGRLAAPARNPARVQAPVVETLVIHGDAATVPWTDAEIAAARADCTKRLAGLALDFEVLPPIKEGMCGAPAPILLKAVGSDPKVEIDPPATVTPLSEHALANALDISEFVFQSGEPVTVLASWPRVVAVPPLPLPNPIRLAIAR